MIDRNVAMELANARLALYEEQGSPELVLLADRTRETEFGWLFFYQAKKYLASGDPNDSVAGNSPLLVDRRSGTLHETGTAREIDWYIENYRRFGSPYPPS